MNTNTNTNFITKETTKRLAKEVADIFKNPLTEQGIYYVHDDSNMLKGYAMIIGPENTLYQYGYYFFEFLFPYNYPQQPPIVKFHTNDGNTRFHPNLYKSGKVCLSIINTWRGEGWTSCQTIKSVLLTLVSILDDNPFLNEPGIKENHPEIKKYNEIITYKNLEIALFNMINKNSLKQQYEQLFYKYIIENYYKNKSKILNFIKDNINIKKNTVVTFYNMSSNIDYKYLFNKFNNFTNLEN
jgi:ubiquitin-protein ligase